MVAIIGMTAYGTILAACGDKSSPATLVSSLSAAPSNPGADLEPSAPSGLTDTDLAVPEDFELAAQKAVTHDTYRTELAAIAKEIHSSK